MLIQCDLLEDIQTRLYECGIYIVSYELIHNTIEGCLIRLTVYAHYFNFNKFLKKHHTSLSSMPTQGEIDVCMGLACRQVGEFCGCQMQKCEQLPYFNKGDFSTTAYELMLCPNKINWKGANDQDLSKIPFNIWEEVYNVYMESLDNEAPLSKEDIKKSIKSRHPVIETKELVEDKLLDNRFSNLDFSS